MKALFAEGDEEANAAYEEVVELMSMAKASGVPDAQLVFDPTLARGRLLHRSDFEVRVPDAPIGSICGGGRYADLTGIWWDGMSGVGKASALIAFTMSWSTTKHSRPESVNEPQVLVAQLDEDGTSHALEAVRKLQLFRSNSPVSRCGGLKKQLKHASELDVGFVMMAGADERSKGVWTVRNMQTGENRVALDEAVSLSVREGRTLF